MNSRREEGRFKRNTRTSFGCHTVGHRTCSWARRQAAATKESSRSCGRARSLQHAASSLLHQLSHLLRELLRLVHHAVNLLLGQPACGGVDRQGVAVWLSGAVQGAWGQGCAPTCAWPFQNKLSPHRVGWASVAAGTCPARQPQCLPALLRQHPARTQPAPNPLTLVVGDGDLLRLAGALVHRRNVQDACGAWHGRGTRGQRGAARGGCITDHAGAGVSQSMQGRVYHRAAKDRIAASLGGHGHSSRRCKVAGGHSRCSRLVRASLAQPTGPPCHDSLAASPLASISKETSI